MKKKKRFIKKTRCNKSSRASNVNRNRSLWIAKEIRTKRLHKPTQATARATKIHENNNWIELNMCSFSVAPSSHLIRAHFLRSSTKKWFFVRRIFHLRLSFSFDFSTIFLKRWTKGRCVALARTAMCIVFWLSVFFFVCASNVLFVSFVNYVAEHVPVTTHNCIRLRA